MITGYLRAVLNSPQMTDEVKFSCIPVKEHQILLAKNIVGRRFRTRNSLRLTCIFNRLSGNISKTTESVKGTYDSTRNLLTIPTELTDRALIIAEVHDMFYVVGMSDSVYQNKLYKFI